MLVEAGRECSALLECNDKNHTVSVNRPQPAIMTLFTPSLKDGGIRGLTIIIPSV